MSPHEAAGIAISTRGLTRRFGDLTAVDGVDLEVRTGEIFGCLGPNGSGKSTLMRMLLGLLEPSAGVATVLGCESPRDAERLRPSVGYMTQRFSLYDDLSVKENLDFAAEIFGLSRRRRRERVEAALAGHGLGPWRSQRAAALSGGWKQRLALAASTIHAPALLVLDEPTAGLDPAQVLEVRDLISALAGRTTVVLSSHVLADVSSVCDRVLMLHLGRLVLAERIDALRRQVRAAGELVLRTRASAEQRAALVARVPEATLHAADEGTDGSVVLHLRIAGGEPASDALTERVTTALAEACVAAGLPVLELGPRSRTLEDLFVDLLGRPAA